MTRAEAIEWFETHMPTKLMPVAKKAYEMAVFALTHQQGEWISVKDRLPEPGQIVLVYQTYSWQRFEDGAEITIGRLRRSNTRCKSYWEFQHYRADFKSGTVLDNDIIWPGNEYITHWMPLPEPPER